MQEVIAVLVRTCLVKLSVEGRGIIRTCHFRVVAHLNNRALALCERESNYHGDYYVFTQRGKIVPKEVAAYMEDCLGGIDRNKMPRR